MNHQLGRIQLLRGFKHLDAAIEELSQYLPTLAIMLEGYRYTDDPFFDLGLAFASDIADLASVFGMCIKKLSVRTREFVLQTAVWQVSIFEWWPGLVIVEFTAIQSRLSPNAHLMLENPAWRSNAVAVLAAETMTPTF